MFKILKVDTTLKDLLEYHFYFTELKEEMDYLLGYSNRRIMEQWNKCEEWLCSGEQKSHYFSYLKPNKNCMLYACMLMSLISS